MVAQAAKVFDVNDYLYGRVILPPFCYDANHRQYPYIYASTPTSVTSGTTKLIDIIIEPDAHFLVEGIQIVPSYVNTYENVYLQILDTTTNAPWSNDTVNLRDFSGKGDTQKTLTDPLLVFPSATLRVSLNNVGTTATFYIVLFGRKIYGLTNDEAALLMKRQWYQYVMTLPTMTNGQVNQMVTLQIFNESDFLIKKMYSTDIINFVSGATAGSESAEIMMQLKDGASDQNFFSQSLAARLVVGSQYSPYNNVSNFTNGSGFFLKKPMFIKRSSSLIGTFANRATTTATALKLVFEGIRIFS